MIHSPYTQAPVKVYVGTDKVVHFVPRQDAQLYLPTLEAEIGHTLVHFLYTGVYATLHIGAEIPAVQLRRAVRVNIAASTV
jgi:hypothetical protein